MRAAVLAPLVLLWVAALMSMAASTGEIKDGCLQRCGNIAIPYPFGTTDECHLSGQPTFFITCNDTAFNPPKPFLNHGNLEVTNISPQGEIDILGLVASDCYDRNGNSTESFRTTLRTGNFTISPTKNKFMAMGCDTNAILRSWLVRGDDSEWFNTGCMSYCTTDAAVEDSSSGIGCCQTPLPGRLWFAEVNLASYHKHMNVSDFNECSYAFVAHNDFNFTKNYLQNFTEESVPVVLDWAVGHQTCEVATLDKSSFLCKANATCFDRSKEGIVGYNCKCKDGYEGNPYLQHPDHGCKDIDECSNPRWHNCAHKCINTQGNYTCQCHKGHHLEKDGKSCSRNTSNLFVVLLATGLGLFAVLLSILGLCDLYRQRKKTKQRHKNFQQNGGMLLRQRLTGSSGQELIKIFSAEELMKATRNYHESRILGKGGQGTVYKGVLADNTTVAIKKSRIGDATEVDQFVNEIFLLSQIKHENVVKIFGCCLETEVPLLVYEFIEHGSLSDRMHKSATHHDNSNDIPWRTRLKLASQTASALSHLHSATPPIVHRDVKLANILLDGNYNAKVSDFGASRLMPANRSELTTLVQGTLGYLDPEYFRTNQLTEKSDVYSFGVVLIEFLTGQKVIDFERPKAEINIALRFISLMREERLLEIIDNRLLEVGDESVVKQLREVAAIARSCVRVRGEERPTMLEIGYELEALKTLGELAFPRTNLKAHLSAVKEESDHLLGELHRVPVDDEAFFTSSSMGFDSINKQIAFGIENAR